MFLRIQKQISHMSRRGKKLTTHKVIAAIAALFLVGSLLPIPKDLRNISADVDTSITLVDGEDIIVNDVSADMDLGGCEIYDGDTPLPLCTLRGAVALAALESGANRIVFDDTIYGEIELDFPLIISDAAALTIQGTIIAGVPQITLLPSDIFVNGVQTDAAPSACTRTNTALPPLIHIASDGHTIDGIALINTELPLVGNLIQIVDADGVTISDNWIGTNTRDNDLHLFWHGAGAHGVCITAQTSAAVSNLVEGNIIVSSFDDGVRIEGAYYDEESDDTYERVSAAGNAIRNNLIGNLTGTEGRGADEEEYTGNFRSGITLKITDFATITSNIITNNGEGTFGDGITLLESNEAWIVGNFIGTSPHPDNNTDLAEAFPLPLNSERLDVSFNNAFDEYIDAHNICDGVAIRFYDHLVTGDRPDACPDQDADLSHTPDDVEVNPAASSQLIGPSIRNAIFNNDIGYNLRNGIYIQSMACSIEVEDEELVVVRSNLPNIVAGLGATPFVVQSIGNTILQNTIFRNDAEVGGAVTGSGSYGMGIDLEDFATASLDISYDLSIANSYWGRAELVERTDFDCPITAPVWQPSQPESDEMDYNITENDNYENTSEDIGYDPDAGANRLVNFPEIDEDASTIYTIVGTAPEGTLVELYQVACASGSGSADLVPTTEGDIRAECDVDYWNEEVSGDIADDHKLGHGQGYRFLGNAYVAVDDDSDTFGEWSISPADFVAEGALLDVQVFNGGIVTATATSIEAACWDNVQDNTCEEGVSPSSVGMISAQRAGSANVSDTGLWLPEDIAAECYGENDPENVTRFFATVDIVMGCFGSTSEFSANVNIQATPEYTLEKTIVEPASSTTVSAGDTVTYEIVLTNTGTSILEIGVGALSDVLSTSLTLVDCEWRKTLDSNDGGGTPESGLCESPNVDGDVLIDTDFGTLDVGAELSISIEAIVNTGLDGDACTIENTVLVDDIIVDGLGNTAVEVGTDADDHTAAELTVDPCGFDPILSIRKNVSVAGGAETSVNSGIAGSPIVGIGQSVTYYIDVVNSGSGALTGLVVTDTFPSLLGAGSWTCRDLTASGSALTSHTSVDYAAGSSSACTVNSTTGVITNISTIVPPESVVRIRLTGRVVPTTTTSLAVVCNAVTAEATDVDDVTDSACFRIGLATLTVVKTVNDTTPTAGDTITYTMTVTNTGTYTATNVVLSDDLNNATNDLIPTCVASVADIALVGTTGTLNTTSGVATWSLGSLTAGASQSRSFTAEIRDDLTTSVTCNNTATVTSENAPTATDDVSITVGIPVPNTVLSISKNVVNAEDIYELGDAVNYRVVVQNTGTTSATNLRVQDSIPSAAEDLRSVTTTTGAATTTNDELSVTGMTAAAAGSATVNYTVSVVEGDDFPLRSYRLDQDADEDDAQFYPERVRSDDIGTDSTYNDPDAALGARDEAYVSLGSGGEIILDVAARRTGLTKLIVDGDGDDFCVAEQDSVNDTDRATERYRVSVSQTTRRSDFEDVGRSRSDSDCFDISDADLTWARYIRIEDTSSSVSGMSPGADIDAVCLLNLGGMVTNTAMLYQGDDLLGSSADTILVNFTDAFENPVRERDCRTTPGTVQVAELPPPPVDLPVYVPPVYVPPTVFALPTTGPVEAGMPVLGGASGLMGMWWMWRRKRL